MLPFIICNISFFIMIQLTHAAQNPASSTANVRKKIVVLDVNVIPSDMGRIARRVSLYTKNIFS